MKTELIKISRVSCLLLLLGWGAAVQSSRAQDVSAFAVFKQASSVQTGPATVSPSVSGPFQFQALVLPTASVVAFVNVATITTPAGLPHQLTNDFLRFSFESKFASKDALNAGYPAGDYTFGFQTLIDGTNSAKLNLGADNYPPTPRISNFASLQAVDPNDVLTVSWDPFTGGTTNDFIRVTIQDEFGNVFASSPGFDEPFALDGTATSFPFDAGTVSSGVTNTVTVTFGRVVARNATDYPGAQGVAGFVSATTTTLAAADDGGGGGPGGIPPVLFIISPANNQLNVPLNSPVSFTFSTAMTQTQAVAWSPNVVAANFSYTWSAGGTKLTAVYNGNFPSNALITWVLNTNVFKSTEGVPLVASLPQFYSGQFTTGTSGGGGGTNNPCDPNQNPGADAFGSVLVSKGASYTQTNTAPPSLDGTSSALFSALVSSPATNPVSSAVLTLPSQTTQTLSNLFGNIFLFQQFATIEAREAAYPPGVYTMTLTRASGGPQAVPLNLPANSDPPTPTVLNLAALQTLTAGAPVTITWNGIPAATTNDSIFISIDSLQTGSNVFRAPDPCAGTTLLSSATSITITNVLQAGTAYEVTLIFTRFLARDTNTIPDIPATALASRTTRFVINKTAGGGGVVPIPPQITTFGLTTNGAFHLTFTGQVGVTYQVFRTTDFITKTPVGIATAPTFEFTDPQASTFLHAFYYIGTSP